MPFRKKGKIAIIENDKLKTLNNTNNHISFPSVFYFKEKKIRFNISRNC